MLALVAAAAAASARTYEDSAAARSAAQSAQQRAESARVCQEDARKKVLELDARAVKEATDLLALYKLKKAAIEELARGYYCSQCGRTGSEIEAAERIPFAQHLSNVQGRAIPAPASKIRAKQQEYDQKIAAARTRVDDARQRFQNEAARNTQCYNQQVAALDEAARAEAWAKTLKGQEELKAAMEKQRKLAEAQAKEKKAKAEAAKKEADRRKAEQAKKLADAARKELERKTADKKKREEKEKQLKDVEKQAAQLMAKYLAEKPALEKSQIAAREERDRQQAEADRALQTNADTVAQLGGFPPAPPPPSPPAPVPPAQAVPLENMSERYSGGILDPNSWNVDRESLFPRPDPTAPLPPPPPGPPPPTLKERLERLGDALMEPSITVPAVNLSLPDVSANPHKLMGQIRNGIREYVWEPVRNAAADFYERQTRPYWDRYYEAFPFLRPDAPPGDPATRGLRDIYGNLIIESGDPLWRRYPSFQQTRDSIGRFNEGNLDTLSEQVRDSDR